VAPCLSISYPSHSSIKTSMRSYIVSPLDPVFNFGLKHPSKNPAQDLKRSAAGAPQGSLWSHDQCPSHHHSVSPTCQRGNQRPGLPRMHRIDPDQVLVNAILQPGNFNKKAASGDADAGHELIGVAQLDHRVTYPSQDIRDASDQLAVFILFKFRQFLTPHHSLFLGRKDLGQFVF